jgi:TetR/AcrR family fatty acid metabolism transcriptional regulator
MARWSDRRTGQGGGRGKKASQPQGEEGRLRSILDAGLRAFARQGFAQTPVAEVAAAAGVASGTVIYHFQTKENLLFILAWECLHMLYRRCSTAVAGAPPGPDRVLAYVDAYFDYLRQEPDRILLLLKTQPRELSEITLAPGLDILTLWQGSRRLLVDAFSESLADNPTEGAEPERLAVSLLAHLSGAAWLHLFFNEDLEGMRESARGVARSLSSGLGRS